MLAGFLGAVSLDGEFDRSPVVTDGYRGQRGRRKAKL